LTGVYLIDKSALARASRNSTVMLALEVLDERGTLATCAITDLEIGYSARNCEEFDSVAADRRALYLELPVVPAASVRARHVQRELVHSGRHRGPGVADLLIAATAELFGAVVIHYDRDFDTIAAVTAQPVEWIVPAGTVP